MFNGKIHYFYDHFPVRYVCFFQRVPEEHVVMDPVFVASGARSSPTELPVPTEMQQSPTSVQAVRGNPGGAGGGFGKWFVQR